MLKLKLTLTCLASSSSPTKGTLPWQRICIRTCIRICDEKRLILYRHKIVAKRGAAFTIMVCTLSSSRPAQADK